MISFEIDGGRFNFRSVAVIICNNHILIHKAVGDNFWALPGGRVELFEFSGNSIVRELSEELGLKINVGRHLWYAENLFEYESKKFHEISNYYLAFPLEPVEIDSGVEFKGIESAVDLVFCWVPLSSVKNYNLKPRFLLNRLLELPCSTESIYINDINT